MRGRGLNWRRVKARLNFGPEDEVSPPRHRKERRREDNRRPPVFGRIGKQVSGTHTANLQNLSAHENNDWRISVHDRLGNRDVHSRLGQRRSSSESPPSSDSEDSRRKRRRRYYREDEDLSLPLASQRSMPLRGHCDFTEDKRRAMPANVKIMMGQVILDDHLKIFESAGPPPLKTGHYPVYVGATCFIPISRNARNCVARNPVELAREKQRQSEVHKRLRVGSAIRRNAYIVLINGKPRAQQGKGLLKQQSQGNTPGDKSNDQDDIATESSNFQNHLHAHLRKSSEGNGLLRSFIRQKGHTTNECVQLRQLIDKLVKEGRLDHLVKNIKEGKDKQRGGGKKDAPRDKADTIYMVQPWQRKTKQKVSQKFSQGVKPGPDVVDWLHGRKDLPGATTLPVYMLRIKEHSTSAWMNFMVIRFTSPYNGIIGRQGFSAIPTRNMVPSTAHWGCLKFPSRRNCHIYNTAAPPKECNTVTEKNPVGKLQSALRQFWVDGTKLVGGRRHVPRILDRDGRHQAVSRQNKSGHPTSFTAHDERSPVVKWEVSRFEQISYTGQQTSHFPLFITLKKCAKKGDFRWTTEAEEAFTQLKQHIAALPTLVAPRPGEELIMYLSATHGAISAVLLTDRDSVQTPVYFVSKATSMKRRSTYSAMEKTDPGVSYCRQKICVRMYLHCVDGSGAGLILTNPEGMEFTYALRFEFTATNNEAEYEALLAGLRIAARMGVQDNMVQYLDKTKSLIQGFDRFTIRQVPRGDNKKADALSKIASTSFAHLSKQVLVEILKNKSISEMEISTVIEEQDPTWMTPIVEFINAGTLPHEQKDARRIRRTAQRFELREGVLYRRSFLQPWLVLRLEPKNLFRQTMCSAKSMRVHAVCTPDHVLWWQKPLPVWVLLGLPMHRRQARDMIKEMYGLPVHRTNPSKTTTGSSTNPLTMAFHMWVVSNIAGPFPAAAGEDWKFLIVAIDYFTPNGLRRKRGRTITGIRVKRLSGITLTNGLDDASKSSLEEKESMRAWIDTKAGGVDGRRLWDVKGLRVSFANDAQKSRGRTQESLGQRGKGPYEVTEALGKGAYKLRDMDGRELPRTWNICHLKKCYL
ncbi:reverse transcriptase domain-containing protein [Tanacetum coccineum]